MSGIGLGLMVADQAAREHGGSLNLEESIPGKTAFVLRLPKLILEAALIEKRSG
jgi:signal transduction histidine kinase